MNINAVFVRSTDEYRAFEPDSPLRTILLSQRATFVNRYTSQLKAYNNDHAAVKLGQSNPTFNSTIITVSSEFHVLKEYLNAVGFREMGLTTSNYKELAAHLFYSWICYHSIMGILRNAGQKTGVCYFIDESHIRLNDDDIMNYIKTLDLLDHDCAAKATKRFFQHSLEVASQIHVARLDECEHTVMYQIFALKVAAKLFPDNKLFSEAINDLFTHLQKHYEKSFDDPALKLGNMILMLSALERSTVCFNDYITELYLNGYSTVLGKLVSEREEIELPKCKQEPQD
ncbi:hypothetical protein M3Y97_00624100 [Aphelenchoides bicaudatus]|nr:hypothetical protein M3Y97_00624100 [Aphelenchoides bicaudatus]